MKISKPIRVTRTKQIRRTLEEANRRLRAEIAARERVQAALQVSELQLRAIIHNFPMGAMIMVDRDMRYVVADGMALVETGFDPPNMIGKRIEEVLAPERVAFIRNNFERAFNGETFVEESLFADLYFVQTYSPIYDSNGVLRWALATVQNLTELRRLKQIREELENTNTELNETVVKLEAANAEIQRFVSIISHDFRAPLINLTGFAHLLGDSVETIRQTLDERAVLPEDARARLDPLFSEDVPTALGFIDSAIHRLDALTSAVLRLSRLGRVELAIRPLEVRPIIERILDSLAAQIHDRDIVITIESVLDVSSDPVALDQIFGNILTNAVQYLAPDRRGQIVIGCERGEGETIYRIHDNGRGIAPSDIDLVFEPFRRAGRPVGEGEGMGLSYVQTLVRRLGGRIWFDSTVDVGTTFYVSLPDLLTNVEST